MPVIAVSFEDTKKNYVQSIDSGFNYMKWHVESKEIAKNYTLLMQNVSYIEAEFGLMAQFHSENCFIGTNAGIIRGYSLRTQQEILHISLPDCIIMRFNR